MQTTSNRLSRLRLATKSSAEECAYRLYIQANDLIKLDAWITWERSKHSSADELQLIQNLDDISLIFGVDRQCLEDETTPQPKEGKTLSFPIR